MAIFGGVTVTGRHVVGAATVALIGGGIAALVLLYGPTPWGRKAATAPPIKTVADRKSTAASAAPKPAAKPIATPTPVAAAPAPVAPKPALIGMYVDEAPGDPAAMTTLDWAHSADMNVVYNYSSIDGTPAEITAYLSHAQSLGIQVIFSLHNLYDQLPDGAAMAESYPDFGTTNASIAQGVVQDFASNPATWGFSITDEDPEQPADLPAWLPALTARYQQIKAITNKPVMAVMVGDTGDQPAVRRGFLSSIRQASDTLALDYYPVPYEPIGRIGDFASDLPATGTTNGWAVVQDFSWASYPDTAAGLGYNLAAARPPTTAEMVSMGRTALADGAKNLLFYSYFDIKNDPNQTAALKAAVGQIESNSL